MYRLWKIKTACPRGPRIYSLEEKNGKKSVYFEGLFMLSWLQDMCNYLYGRYYAFENSF